MVRCGTQLRNSPSPSISSEALDSRGDSRPLHGSIGWPRKPPRVEEVEVVHGTDDHP